MNPLRGSEGSNPSLSAMENPSMTKRSPTAEELVAEFADTVAAQTDAIWNGDARTGNRHAKRPDVRIKAAACLLRIATTKRWPCVGRPAVESMVAFLAQQCLKR